METQEFLNIHYKDIEYKTKSQGHFYLTKSEGFVPRWAVFLDEPEMEIWDDGSIIWVNPNDSIFWCGINVEIEELIGISKNYKSAISYNASVSKIYANIADIVQRVKANFKFEAKEINGVTKLYASIIKDNENMTNEKINTFPTAEMAKAMTEEANNQVPHPLCVQQLEDVLEKMKETIRMGVDGFDLEYPIRQDTKDFLMGKGYSVSDNTVPTLTGTLSKTVGHRISW